MPIAFNNTYSRLPQAFHVRVRPQPVSEPSLIALNEPWASELGLPIELLRGDAGVRLLSGNEFTDESDPVAMAYAGHQFGGFVPSLGDGRAMLLGEVVSADGTRWDIHLKGSGPTPFSRGGDGRSALGPVLREYLLSEAMAALGVSTTRALAAIVSGDEVFREGMVAGGVFARVARSHIRVGTFEWFASRGDTANLKILADYAIDRLYPEAKEGENPYLELLRLVVERQARLIAHWMQLGFIHGVMNTDNMNISGETIDYGPCAFMDAYHPAKTFSSIDHRGRYSFSNQAPIGHWNLTRFAETLLPLLDADQKTAVAAAEDVLGGYSEIFKGALQERFLAKIGVPNGTDADWPLVESLLSNMAQEQADFTLVFRHLTTVLRTDEEQSVAGCFNDPEPMKDWLGRWRARLSDVDHDEAERLMRGANPVFIPRNHRVEETIRAGYEGDFEPFHRLHQVLKRPFDEQPGFGEYENAPNAEEEVTATFCGT